MLTTILLALLSFPGVAVLFVVALIAVIVLSLTSIFKLGCRGDVLGIIGVIVAAIVLFTLLVGAAPLLPIAMILAPVAVLFIGVEKLGETWGEVRRHWQEQLKSRFAGAY